MTQSLDFTGERFVPGAAEGEIVYEHVHRYAFARRFAAGRRVLDAACGEGYGSALLAEVAASVTGVDVEPAAIAHARDAYAGRGNLAFVEASVDTLPFPDGAFDLVVSFETIEHLPATLQGPMLDEFARVLAPGGVLLLSSPNRPEYSEARGYANPFHLAELDRGELASLLAARFPAQRWLRQRLWLGSLIVAESGGTHCEQWDGGPGAVAPAVPPAATYYVVLAARESGALPDVPARSLLSDAAESELRRHEAQAREVLRLDALVGEMRAALDRQTAHVLHLEKLVAYRESLVETRDSELRGRATHVASLEADVRAAREAHEASVAECQRLERALAAQERLIDYRQSIAWWLKLPALRARLWWQRIRGA